MGLAVAIALVGHQHAPENQRKMILSSNAGAARVHCMTFSESCLMK